MVLSDGGSRLAKLHPMLDLRAGQCSVVPIHCVLHITYKAKAIPIIHVIHILEYSVPEAHLLTFDVKCLGEGVFRNLFEDFGGGVYSIKLELVAGVD